MSVVNYFLKNFIEVFRRKESADFGDQSMLKLPPRLLFSCANLDPVKSTEN